MPLLIAVALAIGLGLVVSLLGLAVVLRPRRSKGERGEKIAAAELRDLDPARYRVFHDLYLPRPDGAGSTQVDHAVVSRCGIFVIETKYYNGWIFGSARQKMWTQAIYGNNTQFPNPLRQNHLHVLAMKAFLGLPDRCFHSLVYFVDGDFRTEMPENVIGSDLCGWIGLRAGRLLDEGDFEDAVMKLEDLERMTDRKTARAKHLQELKERKTMAAAAPRPAPSSGSACTQPPPLPASPWHGPPSLPAHAGAGQASSALHPPGD